ncbi:hypothetical protein BY458DRAFT_507376 [Sporodiniella umbellata]|nr:hypothetical protein BY458DRAFT_507376 [Sporodiniella umbellata]
MYIQAFYFLITLQWSLLNACGIAVHNEITYRSLERFETSSELHTLYKNTILDSPEYSQSGSFFPDWGYNCLGYTQQSEDAHWPTFIKTAVNYIREVYPKSEFHNNPHVKGLISFIMSTMSHGMADVKWHSLGGLSDYFIVAMANSDFHGNTNEAHTVADAGAEFALRHSSPLSYLNKTWKIPVKDLVAIYQRLYAQSSTKVPLQEHIQYCMAAAFAASKIDVEFGQWMFGYFGAKGPFLVEELYDYNRGGIHDMSKTVSDCYPQMIDAFENGIAYSHPDVLCADYFNTLQHTPHCRSINFTHAQLDDIQQTYDSETGVLSLNFLDRSIHQSIQTVLKIPHLPSICEPLKPTVTLSSEPGGIGHQILEGESGWDLAISAPYYQNTGAVFLLNRANLTLGNQELSEVSFRTLQASCGRFGWAMTRLDLNQDGIQDLAVACPSDQKGGSSVYIYFGLRDRTLAAEPNVRIELSFQGTVLTAIDVDSDGHLDLVVGCPLCSVDGQLQSGRVYIYRSRPFFAPRVMQADLELENPNKGASSAYDHFGESIVFLNHQLWIGAPGFSSVDRQRAGKVYSFDGNTLNLLSAVAGSYEFQQFGKTLAVNQHMLAIASPSEKTTVGINSFWQAGTVRVYDVKKIMSKHPVERDMNYGLIKTLMGKTNSGHFGQSLSINDQNELWIGEPMSDQENGRVYKWAFGQSHKLGCTKNEKELVSDFMCVPGISFIFVFRRDLALR